MFQSASICARFIALSLIGLAISSAGCVTLNQGPIVAESYNVPPALMAKDEPIIERGKRRPVIDAVGWVIGIPSKLTLWNIRAENHNISPETEALLAEYIEKNGLQHVKFRLNQYNPWDDWKRLTRNHSVGWGWRYTLGTLSVLGETLLPGRIIGGDHYNPFTSTVHLYSDIPAIAFHEAAHAKDFSRRKYPGTYAAVYLLPVVPLWHESIASSDVIAYVEFLGDVKQRKEAYHVLYPAYGTYVGSAVGWGVPKYSEAFWLGGVLAGHAVGRWKGAHVFPYDEPTPQEPTFVNPSPNPPSWGHEESALGR